MSAPALPGAVDATPSPSAAQDGWPVAATQVSLPSADKLMADTERYGDTFQLVAIRDGEIICAQPRSHL